nr:proline-rich receptor-like protein kinase PERK9 [Bactrocera oleae]
MDVEMPTTPTPTVRSAINVPRTGPIPAPRATAATTVTAVARNTAQPPPASPLMPPEPHRTRCPLCRRSHRLQHSSIFKSMQPSQRQRVAQAHGHCLNCLSLTHTTQERDVRRPPAPRSRGAVRRPPPSHPIQHQRPAAAPQYRPRNTRNETPARRRRPRPSSRRPTGLSSVVATLQQLQNLLG